MAGAITKAPGIRDRSVVKSSVIPSTKYSCSGSRAAFVNGSTTMDCGGALVVSLGWGMDVVGASANRALTAIVCPDGPRYAHSAARHKKPTARAAAYPGQAFLCMSGCESSHDRLAIFSGPSS